MVGHFVRADRRNFTEKIKKKLGKKDRWARWGSREVRKKETRKERGWKRENAKI